MKWFNKEKERKVDGGRGGEGKMEEEEERWRREEGRRGRGLVDGRDK